MKIYTLADWLRDRLRERTLSQRQLARQTGIATGTISTTLHGHVPRPVVVQKLAEFFDADAGTVLEIAGFLQLSDVPGELPAEIKDIVRRLYRLPTRERNAILKQVNQLLDLLEDRAGPPV
jgi:transcriptional regulator with XRE-family HTH domain